MGCRLGAAADVATARRERSMSAPSARLPGSRFWPWLLVGALFGAGRWVLAAPVLWVDEQQHVPWIREFMLGRFRIHPTVTLLPTYHLMVAGLAGLAGVESLNGLRLISLGLALASALPFYRIAAKLTPETAAMRTCCYLLLPVAFPYYFLIYTDLPALLFLLLAVAATLEERSHLAGICAALSTVVRQTHVVWMIFLLGFSYISQYGIRPRRRVVGRHLRKNWVLLTGLGLFGLFVVVNRGVALGDRAMHPLAAPDTGNLFFSLLLFAGVFAPPIAAGAGRSFRQLSERPVLFLLPLLGFVLYLSTFAVSHPYNHVPFYLHNMILRAMTAGVVAKVLWFAPIAAALLAIAAIPLTSPAAYFLYPCWVLSVLPMGMVEHRYCLVPLVLFMLFRKSDRKWTEPAMLLLYAAADAVLLIGLQHRAFFP